MNTSHADKNTLDIVMQRAGGAVGLAKRINALGRKIRYQSIQGWIKRGYIPPKSFEVVEMAVGGEVTTQMMLIDFLRKKQGATQETPHGTEATPTAARSSDTVTPAVLESGAATQGCPSQPVEH